MKIATASLTAVLLIVLVYSGDTSADIVTTRSGEEYVGKITDIGREIIVKTKVRGKTQTITLSKSDIISWEKISVEEKYQQKLRQIKTKSIDKHIKLAEWCGDKAMPEKEKAEYRKAYILKKADTGFSNINDMIKAAKWCIKHLLKDEAVFELETVLDLDPDNSEAKELMAKLGKSVGSSGRLASFDIDMKKLKDLPLIAEDIKRCKENACDACKSGLADTTKPCLVCNCLIGTKGDKVAEIKHGFEKDWETDKNCIVIAAKDKDGKTAQAAGVLYKTLIATPLYKTSDGKVKRGTQLHLLLSRTPLNVKAKGVYEKVAMVNKKPVDIIEKYEEGKLFISDEENDLHIVKNKIKDIPFEKVPTNVAGIGVRYSWKWVLVDEFGNVHEIAEVTALTIAGTLVVDETTKKFHTMKCLDTMDILARGSNLFIVALPKNVKGKLGNKFRLPYWREMTGNELGLKYRACEKCITE